MDDVLNGRPLNPSIGLGSREIGLIHFGQYIALAGFVSMLNL